jgi:hypothetical protein
MNLAPVQGPRRQPRHVVMRATSRVARVLRFRALFHGFVPSLLALFCTAESTLQNSSAFAMLLQPLQALVRSQWL